MSSKARIGVVGCGWWSTQFHIPALLDYPGAELVALADIHRHKLDAAGDFYGIRRRFQQAEELFHSGLIQGAVIATPHATHYPLAREALQAGVHVLVEKPLVLKAKEAWELAALAEKQGLHLAVGYTYQHTRATQRCREILRSGRIGRLLCVSCLFSSMVEAYYGGRPEEYREVFRFPLTGPEPDTYSNPQLCGGGQGQTQMTHSMGMVFYVTGDRAERVSAYLENAHLPVDLADAVCYRLKSGAVGTATSMGSLLPGQPQQQELRYYGTRGFVLQELLGGTLQAYFNDGTQEEIHLSEEEVYPAHTPARNLADVITGRAENLAPPEPAACTVEFLEAVYRSARSGREVKIPLSPHPSPEEDNP